MKPSLRAVDGVTTPPSFNSSRLLLGLITVLVVGVSFTNIVIGHRANLFQPQQNLEAPFERPKRELAPLGDDTDSYQQVYDGDVVTKILKGEKPFPKIYGRGLRLKYRPGTLRMSSADALQHCFVNVTRYEGHNLADRNRKQSLVSVSDEYELIYRNVPKSSSSSARHAMQDYLEGEDYRLKHDDMEKMVHDKNYTMISFVRDPLNRFYSSYDEAFFRMGPWMGRGPIVRDKPRIRKMYHENKYKVDKYPYLYEGFNGIEDFRRKYCPEEVLNTGKFLACNEIPSIDDGDLAHRFDQFVRDYSGLDPHDIHLNLQVTNLVFPSGEPMPITTLYNSTKAEKGWQEVAGRRGVNIPDGEMTHGRKITRRFNVSKVTDAAKRKICSILALDYCCLNIELPEVCRDDPDGFNDAVYCAMEQRDEELMEFALTPLVIQSWQDPGYDLPH